MRFISAFVVTSLAVLTGCGTDPESELGRADEEKNGIVFGITQQTDETTGKTVTTAGHEYLFLDGKSMSSGPLSWSRQSWPDGWCRRFVTKSESARRAMLDEGRAQFAGGRLEGAPIVVDAQGGGATFEGAAFEAGRPLRFDVESGFGIPAFEPIEVPAPNDALRITSSNLDREREVVFVESGKDFRVEWSAQDDRRANVMIAFDSDDGRDHIRCFVRESDGAVDVKADHFRDLRTGKLTVASHRNAVVTPGDGWLVEVVATIVTFEKRFVVQPASERRDACLGGRTCASPPSSSSPLLSH
jgi:hypothetical protein